MSSRKLSMKCPDCNSTVTKLGDTKGLYYCDYCSKVVNVPTFKITTNPRGHASGKRVKNNPDFEDNAHEFLIQAREKGYETYTEYLEYLAQVRGFRNNKEYIKHCLALRGLDTPTEHKEQLAAARGLKTASEYDKALAIERSKRPRNKAFAEWLNTSLALIGKGTAWLSQQLGIAPNRISDYQKGYNIPKKKRLNQIKYLFEQYAHPGTKLPRPPEL